MKPRKPIRRKTPLARGSARLKRTRLVRRPAKDAASAREFRQLVLDRAKGRCEACPILAGSGHPDAIAVAIGCRGRAEHAHHMQPRGMGGHGSNDPSNGLACCHVSHEWIESNRRAAYEIGVLRRHA